MSEQPTRLHVNRMNFVHEGKKYFFTVQDKLNESGRGKDIYVGKFCRDQGTEFANESLPAGVQFDTLYCLKEATVYLPIDGQSYPQHRQFWDFFPFEGDNLRQIVALNDDARRMAGLIIDGTMDPFGAGDKQAFKCAVVEPLYVPFDVKLFPTCREKIDCLLQIIAGLNQLARNKTLKKYKIVAHRDLKFKNVMVEYGEGGTYRLRIIDFPSVKLYNKEGDRGESHTFLGFFSTENTAPEDVIPSYSITAKTDVFALGTMLAEIFEIWDLEGESEKNPLSLLYKTVGNIDFSDARQCGHFYETMNKTYAYENADVAGWLEQVLAAHDKAACWDAITLTCPDVRRLFRAATAIDPSHRMTLRRFEEELKQISRGLHSKTVSVSHTEEREETVEQTVYFLVDTTQKDSYCDAYLAAMQNVLATMDKDTKVAVLSYGSEHMQRPLHPNTDMFQADRLEHTFVSEYVRRLPATIRGKMDVSMVKRCLHDLLMYLKSTANRQRFNGEIHIFAPEAPNEGNAGQFSVFEINAEGITVETYYSGSQIMQTFGKSTDKVYVHTFNDGGAVNRDAWYTLIPLPAERPVPLQAGVQAQAVTPTVVANEQTPIRRKGRGFCLVGGAPRR